MSEGLKTIVGYPHKRHNYDMSFTIFCEIAIACNKKIHMAFATDRRKSHSLYKNNVIIPDHKFGKTDL